MKLYNQGKPNKTLFTILEAASRTPEIVLADISAYVGACTVAENRFLELVEEHGASTLDLSLIHI